MGKAWGLGEGAAPSTSRVRPHFPCRACQVAPKPKLGWAPGARTTNPLRLFQLEPIRSIQPSPPFAASSSSPAIRLLSSSLSLPSCPAWLPLSIARYERSSVLSPFSPIEALSPKVPIAMFFKSTLLALLSVQAFGSVAAAPAQVSLTPTLFVACDGVCQR